MLRKIISMAIMFCMAFEQSGFAQVAPQMGIPSYLVNILPQDRFRPLHLRSVSIDPSTNTYNLLLDKGDISGLSAKSVEVTAKKLLQYFKIGLRLPNSMFWVNLRPDTDKDVIDPNLEKTDMGRILLAADVQLKKDVARFTSPDTKEGKEYWNKLYTKAESLFGADEDMDIPTVIRPWIVPGEIILKQSGQGAYVHKAVMKVCLEQDWIKEVGSLKLGVGSEDTRGKELNAYSAQLIREIVIPKLTREVNSSKRYNELRQVFYSLVLAQWVKKSGVGSRELGVWNGETVDSKDLTGLTSKESWSKQEYYQSYRKSFQQGEYNKEEKVTTGNSITIRRYFSGGFSGMIQPSAMTVIAGKNVGQTPDVIGVRIADDKATILAGIQPETGPVVRDGGRTQEFTSASVAQTAAVKSRIEAELDAMAKQLDMPRDSEIFNQISGHAEKALSKIAQRLARKEIDPSMAINVGAEGESVKANSDVMRIGVYPVAGNPFHWAHLLIGLDAMAEFALDKVVFVVAGSDDRKPDLVPAEIRHPMDQQVLDIFKPFFEYSPIAVGTLLDGETNIFRILERNPQQKIDSFYMVGDDHYARLTKTGTPDTIQKLEDNISKGIYNYNSARHSVSPIFIEREFRPHNVDSSLDIKFLPAIEFPASSTDIRKGNYTIMPFTAFKYARDNRLYNMLTNPIKERIKAEVEAMALLSGQTTEATPYKQILKIADENLDKIAQLYKDGKINPDYTIRVGERDEQITPNKDVIRVGIFPVAANPFHWAHLLIGLKAIAEHELDRVIYVVAGHDSRKDVLAETQAHRHEMAQQVLDIFSPLYQYSPIAYNTLNDGETNIFKMLELNPEQKIDAFYLVGGDHYNRTYIDDEGVERLDTIGKLEKSARDGIYNRNMHSISALFIQRGKRGPKVETDIDVNFLDAIEFEASSTQIRGGDFSIMPYTAFDYASKNGMYGIQRDGGAAVSDVASVFSGMDAIEAARKAGVLVQVIDLLHHGGNTNGERLYAVSKLLQETGLAKDRAFMKEVYAILEQRHIDKDGGVAIDTASFANTGFDAMEISRRADVLFQIKDILAHGANSNGEKLYKVKQLLDKTGLNKDRDFMKEVYSVLESRYNYAESLKDGGSGYNEFSESGWRDYQAQRDRDSFARETYRRELDNVLKNMTFSSGNVDRDHQIAEKIAWERTEKILSNMPVSAFRDGGSSDLDNLIAHFKSQIYTAQKELKDLDDLEASLRAKQSGDNQYEPINIMPGRRSRLLTQISVDEELVKKYEDLKAGLDRVPGESVKDGGSAVSQVWDRLGEFFAPSEAGQLGLETALERLRGFKSWIRSNAGTWNQQDREEVFGAVMSLAKVSTAEGYAQTVRSYAQKGIILDSETDLVQMAQLDRFAERDSFNAPAQIGDHSVIDASRWRSFGKAGLVMLFASVLMSAPALSDTVQDPIVEKYSDIIFKSDNSELRFQALEDMSALDDLSSTSQVYKRILANTSDNLDLRYAAYNELHDVYKKMLDTYDSDYRNIQGVRLDYFIANLSNAELSAHAKVVLDKDLAFDTRFAALKSLNPVESVAIYEYILASQKEDFSELRADDFRQLEQYSFEQLVSVYASPELRNKEAQSSLVLTLGALGLVVGLCGGAFIVDRAMNQIPSYESYHDGGVDISKKNISRMEDYVAGIKREFGIFHVNSLWSSTNFVNFLVDSIPYRLNSYSDERLDPIDGIILLEVIAEGIQKRFNTHAGQVYFKEAIEQLKKREIRFNSDLYEYRTRQENPIYRDIVNSVLKDGGTGNVSDALELEMYNAGMLGVIRSPHHYSSARIVETVDSLLELYAKYDQIIEPYIMELVTNMSDHVANAVVEFIWEERYPRYIYTFEKSIETIVCYFKYSESSRKKEILELLKDVMKKEKKFYETAVARYDEDKVYSNYFGRIIDIIDGKYDRGASNIERLKTDIQTMNSREGFDILLDDVENIKDASLRMEMLLRLLDRIQSVYLNQIRELENESVNASSERINELEQASVGSLIKVIISSLRDFRNDRVFERLYNLGIGNDMPSGLLQFFALVSLESSAAGISFIEKKLSDDKSSLLTEKQRAALEEAVKSGKEDLNRDGGLIDSYKQLQQTIDNLLSSEKVGGVDFRAMPAVNQPVPAVIIPSIPVSIAQLDKDWDGICKQLKTGEVPYEQLKLYVAACVSNKEAVKQSQQVAACINNILKLEEDAAVETSAQMKEILALVG